MSSRNRKRKNPTTLPQLPFCHHFVFFSHLSPHNDTLKAWWGRKDPQQQLGRCGQQGAVSPQERVRFCTHPPAKALPTLFSLKRGSCDFRPTTPGLSEVQALPAVPVTTAGAAGRYWAPGAPPGLVPAVHRGTLCPLPLLAHRCHLPAGVRGDKEDPRHTVAHAHAETPAKPRY